jgi:hypothetical protein
MTRDDIIRMALDAHLLNYVDLETPRRYFICADAGVEEVERFAAHVAALEREACAKVCEELRDEYGFEPYGTECAAAIRARGKV